MADTSEVPQRDLDYISDPMTWTQMVCPLKKDGGHICYMIGDGPNIYHGNMWAMGPDDRKETFASFAAILEAGWRVD